MDLDTNTKRILYILNVFIGLTVFTLLYIRLNSLDGPSGPAGIRGSLGSQGPITFAEPGPSGPLGPSGNPGLPGGIGSRGPTGSQFQYDITKENVTVAYEDVSGPYAFNSFDSVQGNQVNFVFPSTLLSKPYAFIANMMETTGSAYIDQTTDNNVQDITFYLPRDSGIGATGSTGPTGSVGQNAITVSGFVASNYVGATGVTQTVSGPTGPTGVSFGDGLDPNSIFYNGNLAYYNLTGNKYVATNNVNFKFNDVSVLDGPEIRAANITANKINFGPSGIFWNGYKSYGGSYEYNQTPLPGPGPNPTGESYYVLGKINRSQLRGIIIVSANLSWQNFVLGSYDTDEPPVPPTRFGVAQIMYYAFLPLGIANSTSPQITIMYPQSDILPFDPNTGLRNTTKLAREPGYFFPGFVGDASAGYNSPQNNESILSPDNQTGLILIRNETPPNAVGTFEIRFYVQNMNYWNYFNTVIVPASAKLQWNIITLDR